MASFSIPADFQTSSIQEISKRNENWRIPVKDVYGSLKSSFLGSGRISAVLKPIKFGQLKNYVESCNKANITFSYTLNFNCTSNMEFTDKGKKQIIKFLRKLGAAGIDRFTVVLPPMIDLITYALPEAKISISVISDVDSYHRLKQFVTSKNVDRVIFPEYMNRKISRIEELTAHGKDFGVDFGTIVNSLCLVDCPFRAFHYSFNAHGRKSKNYQPGDYYSTRCALIKLDDPVELLKTGWIRPEDLKHYVDSGINLFKIAGRELVKPDFMRVVDIYNQGTFDGNLWDLYRGFCDTSGNPEIFHYNKVFDMQNKDLGQFTQRFFKAKSFCTGKDCASCNYCNENAHLVHVNNYEQWKRKLEERKEMIINKNTRRM
jgi:collagenase-like PrtC family protease